MLELTLTKGENRVKSILNLAVVNFRAEWGDKSQNFERIKGYIECAYKRGVEFIVFPEMSLTGYDDDNDETTSKIQKMQVINAESQKGYVAEELMKLASLYQMFIVVGLPEQEGENVYNSAFIAKPDGTIESYRKIHLALDEPNWATPGDKPCLLDTPWGKVGVCICYDIYSFPELARYYAAKGARLVINPTAYAKSRGFKKGKTTLESTVLMNGIYIATANLCGKDLLSDFWGGSNIVGPSQKMQDIHYYAGYPFGHENGQEQELYMATIDLTLAHRGVFEQNPLLGRADFRPEIYARLYNELSSQMK